MSNAYRDFSENVAADAASLAASGVRAVGRYYDYGNGPKVLTRAEAKALQAHDIAIWVVFEFKNRVEYFSSREGTLDAQRALECAQRDVGQPEGTTIYFAADYNEAGRNYHENIVPYFDAINNAFRREDGSKPYDIGVYSDGYVCARLLDAGLVTKTWLSCSSSFDEHQKFFDSNRWNIAQTCNRNRTDTNDVHGERADYGAFRTLHPLKAPQTTLAAAENALAFAARANANEAAPEPSGSITARAIAIATEEWEYFGESEFDASWHHITKGHTETEPGYSERINLYWRAVGKPDLKGTDTGWPWSAAFISYVMKTAGAGNKFDYSPQHSVYISQAIRDFLAKREDAGYWGERLNAHQPKPGDIVCWTRQAGIDYDHQAGGNYLGHADLVVDVRGNQVIVIGGNVSNSVTKRILFLDAQGYLKPFATPKPGSETLFAVMVDRLG